MEHTVLEMQGITKRFAGVVANHNVNFNLRKGEVHALLGENGAGKTTLMNIVYGLYQQDSGTIFVGGKPVNIQSPKDALALGIGMVHQHFMLVPPMTVAQNVILGQDVSLKMLDTKTIRHEVQTLCERYKFHLDVDTPVENLSVGMQQKVELLKALYRGADILILDEPTAVLTPQEVDDLFVILQELVQQGKSVVFISHKLWEVMKICERVTVLRSGEIVDTVDTCSSSKEQLAALMVGREVSFDYEKTLPEAQSLMLQFDGVSAKGNHLASTLENLSFSIRTGEIVGLAGVDGNGQTEIAEVIMGLRKVSGGRILYQGADMSGSSTRQRIGGGIAFIPEDRLTQGLVLDFTVAENMVLNKYNRPPYTVRHIYRTRAVRDNGTRLVEEYDVRPCNAEAQVRGLSGGNQQKVVIARELCDHPHLILAVHPTRGLDVGASQFVHRKLLAEKEKGASVLLISADLDEILAVSDRVLVLYEGRITGEFRPGERDYADIGLMRGYKGDEGGPSV